MDCTSSNWFLKIANYHCDTRCLCLKSHHQKESYLGWGLLGSCLVPVTQLNFFQEQGWGNIKGETNDSTAGCINGLRGARNGTLAKLGPWAVPAWNMVIQSTCKGLFTLSLSERTKSRLCTEVAVIMDTSGNQTSAITLCLALGFYDIDPFKILSRQLSFKDSKFANLINDLRRHCCL